jgi:cytochrome c-type biogenesis protein
MDSSLSIFVAFAAGLLSFFSPCVLPLIPSYLGFLSGKAGYGLKAAQSATASQDSVVEEEGTAGKTGGKKPRKGRLFVATLFFTAGFSLVFVFLSLFFSGAVFFAGSYTRILNLAAGAVVILLGLQLLLGLIPRLNQVKRFSFFLSPRQGRGSPRSGSLLPGTEAGRPATDGGKAAASAFVMGLAFAAGWTPCVGPILASILLFAGGQGEILRAAFYLAAYALGFALPFWAAALFLDSFLRFSKKIRRCLPAIQTAGAILIILLGVFMITGRLAFLNGLLARAGWALAQAAETPGPLTRFVPAAVFFILALLMGLPWKKRPPVVRLVVAGLLLALALTQAGGLLNTAAFLSRWFLFQGL